MKTISTLAALMIVGFVGAASAQKQEAPKAAAAPAAAAKAPAKAEAKAEAKTEAKKELVDLNSATEKELAALPKIGEAKAKAIVKARPLGGKDELVTKKVLTQAEYDAIKDLIIAKQEAKKEAAKDMKKDAPKEMKKDEKKK